MTMAIGLIGGIFQAIGSIQQANAVAAQEKYNAKVADRNAAYSRARAAADADRKKREYSRIIARNRTAFGAAGLTLDGSPIDFLSDQAAEAELETLIVKHEGEVEAIGYEDQAEIHRMKAKDAKKSGPISAASALVGSFKGSSGGAGLSLIG